MHFKSPLIPGRLLKRYQRFLCDVLLDTGETVTAHCANSGSLQDVKAPGHRVWLSFLPPSSGKKLLYRWELVESAGVLVGVNTQHPNHLLQEALEQGTIPELEGYTSFRREVPYGVNSRIDFLLESISRAPCYVEVKNVHLKRADCAEFPDAVTVRGTKHLKELSTMVQQGNRAVLLYVVQRGDCQVFSLAADIDPSYAQAAQEARHAGVEFLCYQCHITVEGITLHRQLEIKI